mmetsp:Transcript_94599/g.178051  ORF Transcript_94599/g.178051 Transcript_94599/m.178051 type:complete len:259 (-) Transcript_94599:608-1384(-)
MRGLLLQAATPSRTCCTGEPVAMQGSRSSILVPLLAKFFRTASKATNYGAPFQLSTVFPQCRRFCPLVPQRWAPWCWPWWRKRHSPSVPTPAKANPLIDGQVVSAAHPFDLRKSKFICPLRNRIHPKDALWQTWAAGLLPEIGVPVHELSLGQELAPLLPLLELPLQDTLRLVAEWHTETVGATGHSLVNNLLPSIIFALCKEIIQQSMDVVTWILGALSEVLQHPFSNVAKPLRCDQDIGGDDVQRHLDAIFYSVPA